MALLSEAARRDIVHQFDLPERKSKITSLLKQNDQLYCICRSSDSTRFMVACDSCEEWYHGDCVHINESEAKLIKRYYCPLCVTSNPSLKLVYKKKKTSQGPSKDRPSKVDRASKSSRVLKPERSTNDSKVKAPAKAGKKETKTPQCSCAGCSATRDCGFCTNCVQHARGIKKVKPCEGRMCVRYKPPPLAAKRERNLSASSEASFVNSDSMNDEEESWKPEPVVKKRRYTKRAEPKSTTKKPRKEATKVTTAKSKRSTKKRKPRSRSGSDDGEATEPEVLPKQCYGLKCTKAARPNSKYCSESCGFELAHARIYAVLPARMQEWELYPPVAQKHNERDLEEARNKYIKATEESKRLLSEREILEKHIEYVRTLEISPDTCVEEHEEEGSMYCVTCGIEIPVKTCLKHMEKCYNKSESRTTFGSTQKTMMEGPQLFCDFFHPGTNLYCKRLKVLCVEHSKEPKIGELEICGCPLVQNIAEVGNKFCRIKKKKCSKHFCWEKLRRAGIDLERIRQYLKMDEMLEKEANIKAALANRSSVMGRLLHSTFDHDHQERFIKEQERKIAEQLLKANEQLQRDLEAQEQELAAAERRKAETAQHDKVPDKSKRSRAKSIKFEVFAEKVNLPSKREKEHKHRNEASSGSGQVKETAYQLYKRMKASNPD